MSISGLLRTSDIITGLTEGNIMIDIVLQLRLQWSTKETNYFTDSKVKKGHIFLLLLVTAPPPPPRFMFYAPGQRLIYFNFLDVVNCEHCDEIIETSNVDFHTLTQHKKSCFRCTQCQRNFK